MRWLLLLVFLVGCGGVPESPKTPSMADIAEVIRGDKAKQSEELSRIKASSDKAEIVGPPFDGTYWHRYPARDGYVWVLKLPDETLNPKTIQFSQSGAREDQ